MPLILTLKKGDDFFIDNRRFVMEEVFDDRNGIVSDPKTGERFEITDDRATEIAPEVMICAASRPTSINISIEAPRAVRILRGSLKRGGRKQ